MASKSFFGTVVFLLLFIPFSWSQYTPGEQGSFRSVSNSDYWKNRPPYEGYWQQDVHYSINAKLDEKENVLNSNMELVYWNNSPDTLRSLFFHLYPNAYTPGSYLDQYSSDGGRKLRFGKNQADGKAIEIQSMESESGITYEIDNTILKAELNKALLPGEKLIIQVRFKTWLEAGAHGRMRTYTDQWGNTFYKVAHWYPRICVYDAFKGWDTDQHMHHEFYGDFGAFDVRLDLPSNLIADGSGLLMNRLEVLPENLMNKLDVSAFKDKPAGEKPSQPIPYKEGERKEWHFYGENIHDFAFVAGPTFRIEQAKYKNHKVYSLVREDRIPIRPDMAQKTAQLLKFYSEKFGEYPYPKMVVADVPGGMEYPMMVIVGGGAPIAYYILAHEVAHNWFYGAVGSNETQTPALDEGFTQYATVLAMDSLSPSFAGLPRDGGSKYSMKHRISNPLPHNHWHYYRAYLRYMQYAMVEGGTAVDIHADRFDNLYVYGGKAHRQVYEKMATALCNLEYVLGEEAFNKAIRDYYSQWKFCHPYFHNMEATFSASAQTDLSWFFRQWVHENKWIDYKIGRIKTIEKDSLYSIMIKRKASMEMPLQMIVQSETDSVYSFWIPNTWYEKKTDATILPRWIGWDKWNTSYEAVVHIPAGIKNVHLDTTLLLADMNRLNNVKKNKAKVNFDFGLYNTPDWRHYEFNWRPDIWWNAYDGIKLGVRIRSDYMNRYHRLEGGLWFNTGLLQLDFDSTVYSNSFDPISFDISYKTYLDHISRKLEFNVRARMISGAHIYQAGIDRYLKNARFFIGLKTMFRTDSTDLTYLLHKDEWDISPDPEKVYFNNTLNAGIEWKYAKRSNKGSVLFSARTPFVESDFQYSWLQLEWINAKKMGRLNFRSRLFGRYTTGNVPSESALYLAGGSPEEMMDNPFTHGLGFFDRNWSGFGLSTNHFHYGGGLGLRGYSGYWVAQEDAYGNVINTYKGQTGFALNAELEFDELVSFRPKALRSYLDLDLYLFGDAGMLNYYTQDGTHMMSDLRADAGLGAALTIKRWGVLETWKPLTIRFDVPLFLSRPPFVENDYVKYRWIIGVSRAF